MTLILTPAMTPCLMASLAKTLSYSTFGLQHVAKLPHLQDLTDSLVLAYG